MQLHFPEKRQFLLFYSCYTWFTFNIRKLTYISFSLLSIFHKFSNALLKPKQLMVHLLLIPLYFWLSKNADPEH